MVFRRRRGGRRMGNRRKPYRMMRKRGGRRTALSKKVYWFKEPCQGESLSGPTGNNGGLMTFQLSDLANLPSYQNLFDLFKISGVHVKIVPRFNVSEYSAQNISLQAGNLPVLYIAPNRDPFVPAPTTIGDILNDDGCKIIRVTKPINLFLKSPKPDVLMSVGEGQPQQEIPLQFNVGSKYQPWLVTGGINQRINQSGTKHYGYRWLINNPSPTECVFDVYTTYYFACKERD